MRKVRFAEGEYYHVYNRGVEKREIFLTQSGYERFLFLLFACNESRPLANAGFYLRYYGGLASIERYERKGEALVDIVCFCLMPNHYHLLLRERVTGGISAFMQKLGTAYTMFFNTKYERSGSLFQGTFKAVHVDHQEYLSHLTQYIHLNPVELREPRWKENGILNWEDTYTFVKNYPWSSYGNFLGHARFAQILTTTLLPELYGDMHPHESLMQEWLKKEKSFLLQKDITMEA